MVFFHPFHFAFAIDIMCQWQTSCVSGGQQQEFGLAVCSLSTEHLLCRKPQSPKSWLLLQAFAICPCTGDPEQRGGDRTSQSRFLPHLWTPRREGMALASVRKTQFSQSVSVFQLNVPFFIFHLLRILGSIPGFSLARTMTHPLGPNVLCVSCFHVCISHMTERSGEQAAYFLDPLLHLANFFTDWMLNMCSLIK